MERPQEPGIISKAEIKLKRVKLGDENVGGKSDLLVRDRNIRERSKVEDHDKTRLISFKSCFDY